MTFMFWMCMKCGKHARATAQEISCICMEHMCEIQLNDSRCKDCVTEDTELTCPPASPPSSPTSENSEHPRQAK